MRFATWAFAALLCTASMLGCAGVAPRGAHPAKLVLAEQGKTAFTIVTAENPSLVVKHAAEELQRFLGEITGASFPIAADTQAVGEHEIILGDNKHLKSVGAEIDFAKLGDEGYVIRTAGPHLILAGGPKRGTLYAVYGLLEDHLNCRWFTPDVSRIPKQAKLQLGALDETQIPVLESREPFTIDCFDPDWCARNRMNSSSSPLDEAHGGNVRFGGGMFVHTFNRLVPPEKYFDTHPEYFSVIDGKRTKENTQLCCTNEDVIRLCTEGTLEAIRSDPTAFVYSVSQNDWGNYCQCEKCQALATAEDTQMAPVLNLVNRVAEAVEKEFPDKAIETLAYQWTRKAPKTMRPRANVIIRLCSIECCFMHPLDGCDGQPNKAFCRDAEAWAKVAGRLWVWDYVTSFRHFMCPFPNLHVRKPNIEFFVKNNVKGIFEQDNYISRNGELSGLSGYINAKFLWNPAYPGDKAIDEFLEGVYGPAAKPIRAYIDLLQNKVEKDNIHANIWIGPSKNRFLTPDILMQADKLWDKAEKAVAAQPDVLERVRIARLCVDYAYIEIARSEGLDKSLEQEKGGKKFGVVPLKDRITRFFDIAKRANVSHMEEGTMTLDKYREGFQSVLAAQ